MLPWRSSHCQKWSVLVGLSLATNLFRHLVNARVDWQHPNERLWWRNRWIVPFKLRWIEKNEKYRPSKGLQNQLQCSWRVEPPSLYTLGAVEVVEPWKEVRGPVTPGLSWSNHKNVHCMHTCMIWDFVEKAELPIRQIVPYLPNETVSAKSTQQGTVCRLTLST